MSHVTDIEKKRKEKEPKCDYCGESAHTCDLLCPRVASVTYHNDGAVEVNFDTEFFKEEEGQPD